MWRPRVREQAVRGVAEPQPAFADPQPGRPAGPGTIPATTAAPTTAEQTEPQTTAGDEDLDATVTIETATGESEDSESSALPYVIIGLLVAAVVVGGVVLYLRSRRPPPPADPETPQPPNEPPAGAA